mgnify:FL=1
MKTNFRKNKNDDVIQKNVLDETEKKELTKEEFEDFIKKSGAKGSFMIYRSRKKDDELGLDEL